MELVELIIERYEKSRLGRLGELRGRKNWKPQQEDYDRVGKQEFFKQAEELEQQGLLKVKWYDGKSEILNIEYSTECMPILYEKLGRIHPKILLIQYSDALKKTMKNWKKPWILRYGEYLISRLERGDLPSNLKREGFLPCLDALDKLEEPVYKRIFSASCLSDSKAFERALERPIISIARKYCDMVDEAMSDDEVLKQLYVEEYTQQLYIKGSLTIQLEDIILPLKNFPYGIALNAKTLQRAQIPPKQELSKIITIENKANFEFAQQEKETLLIFSHGFFSPKEKEFLLNLHHSLEEQGKKEQRDISYYHSGDLDYGGIRIFHFIREQIFPSLKPLQMDAQTYWTYRNQGYGTEISAETLQKIKCIEEPELEELKICLLKTHIAIEQECFLIEKMRMKRGG